MIDFVLNWLVTLLLKSKNGFLTLKEILKGYKCNTTSRRRYLSILLDLFYFFSIFCNFLSLLPSLQFENLPFSPNEAGEGGGGGNCIVWFCNKRKKNLHQEWNSATTYWFLSLRSSTKWWAEIFFLLRCLVFHIEANAKHQWLVTNRSGPWEGETREALALFLLPALLCPEIFIERERRLSTRRAGDGERIAMARKNWLKLKFYLPFECHSQVLVQLS